MRDLMSTWLVDCQLFCCLSASDRTNLKSKIIINEGNWLILIKEGEYVGNYHLASKEKLTFQSPSNRRRCHFLQKFLYILDHIFLVFCERPYF